MQAKGEHEKTRQSSGLLSEHSSNQSSLTNGIQQVKRFVGASVQAEQCHFFPDFMWRLGARVALQTLHRTDREVFLFFGAVAVDNGSSSSRWLGRTTMSKSVNTEVSCWKKE